MKRQILEIVYELGEATAEDIVEITDRSRESVAMALLRYHRQGLLSRYTLEGRTKVYEINDRGIDRLRYLRSQTNS